ncbi:tRNA (adenosine(37)-N6)-threonylcarbamoyltransferase complex transferase subunit TsaD [Patescibacteria group bacterium]|nr:tRNA (adenosine(37)-N6)-threonylcarbamoyltransferase complex transferase subunit TsaD [Patescibacteria group bacterium]
MRILAIESSCDETSAAIVEGTKQDSVVRTLSKNTSTSLPIHSKTGGIIPEAAAREQIKFIIPVIKKTLKDAGLSFSFKNPPNIDAIAVTIGPGLIGSLLVGVETAKTLSLIWDKPIIPVNHLIGHIYANWLDDKDRTDKKSIEFPAIVLVVSGGHTDLILLKKHEKIVWLGGTRDDAAGEAFDKIGRLLNLPYPGGPNIERLALKGNDQAINFPRPMIGSNDFDFSFSGLKTAVLRETKNRKFNEKEISDICASAQKSIIDVLIKKTLKAARKYKAKSIILSGGVAANDKLRENFKLSITRAQLPINFHAPKKYFCTDNAAMIGAAAIYNYEKRSWKEVEVNPELYFV